MGLHDYQAMLVSDLPKSFNCKQIKIPHINLVIKKYGNTLFFSLINLFLTVLKPKKSFSFSGKLSVSFDYKRTHVIEKSWITCLGYHKTFIPITTARVRYFCHSLNKCLWKENDNLVWWQVKQEWPQSRTKPWETWRNWQSSVFCSIKHKYKRCLHFTSKFKKVARLISRWGMCVKHSSNKHRSLIRTSFGINWSKGWTGRVQNYNREEKSLFSQTYN